MSREDIDMSWYDTPAQYGREERMRLIRQAHVIRPGLPGLDCLAEFEPQWGRPQVIDGWVICSACGNELGRADQLMVKVWDDRNCRVHEGGTCSLAFIG